MRFGGSAAPLLLAAALAGCGSATGSIPTENLGVTARDALLEARSIARAWDAGARLRYVEGENVSANGLALAGGGQWRFHYIAPGRTGELLVRVTGLETASEERAATSPPGYVVGDNALGTAWIDSPDAMAAVLQAREGGAPGLASLLLVPTRPEQWVVRFPDAASERWRVNAETGEVLGS
mgnify:CR=1 FL=1